MNTKRARFCLNQLQVDPDSCRLDAADESRRTPPRLMKLLCLLADAQGATVQRNTLIDALWPRGHVNEEALSRAVADLRRLLGDDAREPRFIETIPKLGYRLVAEIRNPADQAQPEKVAPGHNRSLTVWLVAGLVIAVVAWLILNQERGGPTVFPDPLVSAKRLTADPVMKHHPELSPDGKWLAYVRFNDGRYRLYILPTSDPSQEREIDFPNSLVSPVFNADSTHLAAITTTDQSCAVVQLPLISGEPRRLGSCSQPNESPLLDWSADDRQMAFVDEDTKTGSAAIWMISLADGTRTQLTHPPDAYVFDTRPRFSPDGRMLSFTRGTRAARELWLFDLQDPLANPRQLTFDHQYITSHDWMSDGQSIVLDSDRSGHRALWLLDLQGNWSILGARDAMSPSSGGGKLVFKVVQYESNIWQMDINSGALSDDPLIASSKYDSNPAWSPDGSEIAFTSNRSGNGAIWIATSDGTRERLVYDPEEGRAAWPEWSPDGTFLTATHYAQGQQRLVNITLNERSISTVATGGEKPYGGRYSKDGKWFYYVAVEPGKRTRLWRKAVGVADGKRAVAEIVVSRPVNRFILTDDDWIIYSLHDQSGLYRAPMPEPEKESTVLPDLHPSAWADWAISGNSVYFPAYLPEGGAALFRASLDGGEPFRVSDTIPTALGPTLSIHPHKPEILICRTDRAQSDLFFSTLSD